MKQCLTLLKGGDAMREVWNEPVLTILDVSETEAGWPGVGDDGTIWVNQTTNAKAAGGS